MIKKHRLFALMTALMLILAVSCGPGPDNAVPPVKPNVPDVPVEKSGLKISCTAKKLNRTRGLGGDGVTPVIPEELLVDKAIKPENLKTTVTPKYYIMDIGWINVYQPNNVHDFESGARLNQTVYRDVHDGFNMVNWLVDRGMPSIKIDERSRVWKEAWTGFGIHYLSYLCRSNERDGFDAYYGGSLVGLELPPGITEDMLVNNVVNSQMKKGNLELDPDVVWFDFKSLMPHKSGRNPSELIFQQGIDEMKILNPEGASGEFTHGCFNSRGNPTCIALPMSAPLDFRNIKNPEIEIEYDTENLIQFYQVEGKETPDTRDDKYRAVFNVLDPYPIEISVDEYDHDDIYWYSDNQLETDISKTTLLAGLKVRRYDNHIDLDWIKPNYKDIARIVITHNTVDDESTAETIYQGNDNYFVHKVTDVKAPHYYWGYVVNDDGEMSKGFKFLPAPEKRDPNPNPGNQPVVKDMLVVTKVDLENTYPSFGKWYTDENLDPAIKTTTEVQDLTPTHFYMDFDDVFAYNAKQANDPSKGMKDATGFGYPEFWDNHAPVDIMQNGNRLNSGSTLMYVADYDSFYFHIRSYLMDKGQGSFVGIKLPENIEPKSVDEAIPAESLPSYVDKTGTDIWINLKDLVPTNGKFVDHWCFQKDVTPGVINPDGITDHWSYGPGSGNTDRVGVVLPFTGPFDFKQHDGVELTFYPKDMLSLVSYKNGDSTRYKVILNLEHPFPFKAAPMKVQQ